MKYAAKANPSLCFSQPIAHDDRSAQRPCAERRYSCRQVLCRRFAVRRGPSADGLSLRIRLGKTACEDASPWPVDTRGQPATLSVRRKACRKSSDPPAGQLG
jgi:hypothetical protein